MQRFRLTMLGRLYRRDHRRANYLNLRVSLSIRRGLSYR